MHSQIKCPAYECLHIFFKYLHVSPFSTNTHTPMHTRTKKLGVRHWLWYDPFAFSFPHWTISLRAPACFFTRTLINHMLLQRESLASTSPPCALQLITAVSPNQLYEMGVMEVKTLLWQKTSKCNWIITAKWKHLIAQKCHVFWLRIKSKCLPWSVLFNWFFKAKEIGSLQNLISALFAFLIGNIMSLFDFRIG